MSSSPDELTRWRERMEGRVNDLVRDVAVLANSSDIMQRNQKARQSTSMSWATLIVASVISIVIALIQKVLEGGGIP